MGRPSSASSPRAPSPRSSRSATGTTRQARLLQAELARRLRVGGRQRAGRLGNARESRRRGGRRPLRVSAAGHARPLVPQAGRRHRVLPRRLDSARHATARVVQPRAPAPPRPGRSPSSTTRPSAAAATSAFRACGALLVPLFERHDVDLVLAGHDPNYQRFAPRHGVTYVVDGGGGRPPLLAQEVPRLVPEARPGEEETRVAVPEERRGRAASRGDQAPGVGV
jgi:hypothetical protein